MLLVDLFVSLIAIMLLIVDLMWLVDFRLLLICSVMLPTGLMNLLKIMHWTWRA